MEIESMPHESSPPSSSEKTAQGKTLILGLGNSLCGDDGLGVQAIEMLAAKDLPAGVVVRPAGTPGWALPTWLEGWPRVILIDAVQMGTRPGTRHRFNPEQVSLISGGNILSVHKPDLAAGLALAEALHKLPEVIIVFGIEPEGCEPGADLSRSVQQALDGLIEEIMAEIT
jgi:hydrogenase maturation protease